MRLPRTFIAAALFSSLPCALAFHLLSPFSPSRRSDVTRRSAEATASLETAASSSSSLPLPSVNLLPEPSTQQPKKKVQVKRSRVRFLTEDEKKKVRHLRQRVPVIRRHMKDAAARGDFSLAAQYKAISDALIREDPATGFDSRIQEAVAQQDFRRAAQLRDQREALVDQLPFPNVTTDRLACIIPGQPNAGQPNKVFTCGFSDVTTKLRDVRMMEPPSLPSSQPYPSLVWSTAWSPSSDYLAAFLINPPPDPEGGGDLSPPSSRLFTAVEGVGWQTLGTSADRGDACGSCCLVP